MKTWLLAAGILGMAFTSTAQNASLSSKGSSKTEVLRTEIRAGVFYGTLVSFKQTNTEIVRFNVDDSGDENDQRYGVQKKPGCHDEVPI